MGRRRYGGAFGPPRGSGGMGPPRSGGLRGVVPPDKHSAGIPLDRAVLLRLDADQLGTPRCRARKAEGHLPPSQSEQGRRVWPDAPAAARVRTCVGAGVSAGTAYSQMGVAPLSWFPR